MMTEITEDKIKEIFEKTKLISNLARRKWFILMIFALIECKNVVFYEISLHIKKGTQVDSNLRRIQRFFAQVKFNEEALAHFLVSLLPCGKLTLSIDRTDWEIGKFSCNILMLTGYFKGIGLPLCWHLLPKKRGNSSTEERITLLQKWINWIGTDRIDYLLADREFIGNQWFSWLKSKKINFCIRLPKSHWIRHKGQCFKVESWIKEGEIRVLKQVEVEGIKCNIFGKKLENGEFLLLAGTGYAQKLGEMYRKRWSIEVCFKAFKTYGFYLENTHLQDREKLSKLVALVSIAVGLCIKLGFFLHQKKKKIKIKKHGYKANSFFRSGLDAWRKFLKEQEKELIEYVYSFLRDLKKKLQKAMYLFDFQ